MSSGTAKNKDGENGAAERLTAGCSPLLPAACPHPAQEDAAAPAQPADSTADGSHG